jgi:signal transduction histidine kinase
MNIRNILRYSVFFSVLFPLIIIGSLIYAAVHVDDVVAHGRAADAVVHSAFDLSTLTDEYLAHPNERILSQWRATHAHIGTLLGMLHADSEDERDLLASLREKYDAIRVTFGSDTESDDVLPRLAPREAAQFRSNAQGMVTDASLLAVRYFDEREGARKFAVTVLVVQVLAYSAGMIGIMLLLYGRISQPLYYLREGARRIADGDLNYRLNTRLRDEFGMVARSFDEMAEKLKISRNYLEHTIRELQDQDEKKNTFIAVLSHELRNPLAPIVSNVEYAQMLPVDNAELQSALNVIGRQSRNIKLLLDDLLDVSRMIRGNIELRKEPVDLRELASDALQTTEPLLRDKQQRITSSAPSAPVMVLADALRIEQIITNILTNASKFSPTATDIIVRVYTDNERAYVSIRDQGPGIPESMQEKVFDIFVQGRQHDVRMHSGGGFGIGLSLARSLARLHGGDVIVRSDGEGHGSEFIVILPLYA